MRQGGRRTFQEQYDILLKRDGSTHAGPGESNHNFGQAVDLGFEGLRWLRADGSVVKNEDSWLHRLDPAQQAMGEALIFWDALRAAGTQIGLFRGPVSDRPHLQVWNDADIDMADRLADLLTRVGTMRWSGRRQKYQCDLGLGGDLVAVGSAENIWAGQASISETILTHARARVAAPAGPPRGAGAAPPAASVPPATPQEVAQMQAALRADFEAADTAWESWIAQ